MIHDASQLSHLIQAETRKVHHRITILIMAMIGTLIVFILVNYIFINWKLLRSVANLQEGTTIIGEGNLDYRIEETSRDEIGDLARAFNQMNVNLTNVLASKEELNREVEERKLTEQALRQSEKRYRRISSMTSDIAYCCHKSNDTDYSIEWMTGTKTIIGYSADEIEALKCGASWL